MRVIGQLTTMPRRLLLGVGAIYVLAWCLPSYSFAAFGSRTAFRGPTATREALAPIWPVEGTTTFADWWAQALSVSSALTNLVFVVAFLVAWRWTAPARRVWTYETRPARRLAVRVLTAAAVLNLWWLFVFGFDLREGYYLWVGSFIALAVTLARLDRPARDASAVRAAAW